LQAHARTNLFQIILRGNVKKPLPSRLSESQVLESAKKADLNKEITNTFTIAQADDVDGKIIWTVTSAHKDAKYVVQISDEDGSIIDIKYLGGR